MVRPQEQLAIVHLGACRQVETSCNNDPAKCLLGRLAESLVAD